MAPSDRPSQVVDESIAAKVEETEEVTSRILTPFEETSVSGVGGKSLPFIRGVDEDDMQLQLDDKRSDSDSATLVCPLLLMAVALLWSPCIIGCVLWAGCRYGRRSF